MVEHRLQTIGFAGVVVAINSIGDWNVQLSLLYWPQVSR